MADARRGREAQAIQQRAAAGSYSGGSGPLRGVDGRVITDLNKVCLLACLPALPNV